MNKELNTQIASKYDETKLITIVRSDLHTDGYLIPQTAHALADFAYEFPHEFREWKATSNSLVCLSCKNQEELIKLYKKFSLLTPTIKFYEPDVDEWTSLCLYGTKPIRKKLSNYPLALKNKEAKNEK